MRLIIIIVMNVPVWVYCHHRNINNNKRIVRNLPSEINPSENLCVFVLAVCDDGEACSQYTLLRFDGRKSREKRTKVHLKDVEKRNGQKSSESQKINMKMDWLTIQLFIVCCWSQVTFFSCYQCKITSAFSLDRFTA